MNTKFIKHAFIAAAIFSLAACKKDDKKNNPTTEVLGTPTITITTLTEGDTIQSGVTVNVNGTITSTTEMHGYQVLIHNHATMTDVFTQNVEVHGESFNVSENWVNNVSDTSNMMLKITVAKDDIGSTEVKMINFVCLP